MAGAVIISKTKLDTKMKKAIFTFAIVLIGALSVKAQLKKDGTPDMRYNANKQTYGSSYSTPSYSASKSNNSNYSTSSYSNKYVFGFTVLLKQMLRQDALMHHVLKKKNLTWFRRRLVLGTI